MALNDFIKVGDAADDITLLENEVTSSNQLITTLIKADGTSIESDPVNLPVDTRVMAEIASSGQSTPSDNLVIGGLFLTDV